MHLNLSLVATFKRQRIFIRSMSSDLEKAQVMFKLTRKNNWGSKYDRLEHFKRFPNLDKIVKELSGRGWIIIYKKPKFTGISLDNRHKSEIKEFVETRMPYLKGMTWLT